MGYIDIHCGYVNCVANVSSPYNICPNDTMKNCPMQFKLIKTGACTCGCDYSLANLKPYFFDLPSTKSTKDKEQNGLMWMQAIIVQTCTTGTGFVQETNKSCQAKLST